MENFQKIFMIAGLLGTILVLILIFFSLFDRKTKGIKSNKEVSSLKKLVSPCKILTPYERRMYHILRSVTPPEFDIQYEVSFNALVKCNDIGLRNKFNRNSVDFLIVDKNFIPLVCVELDDDTHRMKSVQKKDEFRDNLLSAVGIPTERFIGLPKSKSEVKFKLSIYFKNHKTSSIYEKLIQEA